MWVHVLGYERSQSFRIVRNNHHVPVDDTLTAINCTVGHEPSHIHSHTAFRIVEALTLKIVYCFLDK